MIPLSVRVSMDLGDLTILFLAGVFVGWLLTALASGLFKR